MPESRDEALSSLRESLLRLRELDFPGHPDDLDLAGCVLDLAEADAYFVGLADSILAGGRPKDAVQDLRDLQERLDDVRVVGENDERVLDHCKVYLAALGSLHAAIKMALPGRR